MAQRSQSGHLAPRHDQHPPGGERSHQGLDQAGAGSLAEVDEHVLADDHLVASRGQSRRRVADLEADPVRQRRGDPDQLPVSTRVALAQRLGQVPSAGAGVEAESSDGRGRFAAVHAHHAPRAVPRCGVDHHRQGPRLFPGRASHGQPANARRSCLVEVVAERLPLRRVAVEARLAHPQDVRQGRELAIVAAEQGHHSGPIESPRPAELVRRLLDPLSEPARTASAPDADTVVPFQKREHTREFRVRQGHGGWIVAQVTASDEAVPAHALDRPSDPRYDVGMSRNVRVAVVGVGAWGERQLRACEQARGLRVTALCDPRPDRLRALRPELPAFPDLARLLEAGLADGAVIATPNASHARLAAQALEAGLHVLVEKPLALTREDAERVAALAVQRSRVAMVGHLLEHHPRVLALEALVAAGKLGALERLESRRLATRLTRDDPWWTLAPHDISLALRFAGSPRALRFVGERAGAELYEIEHATGIVTRIEVGFGHGTKVRELRLVGRAAAAVFDDTAAPAAPSPLQRQASAFAAAILSGAVARGGVAHGVEVVRWLEVGARARERARRGAA